jgi:hypothetical protein
MRQTWRDDEDTDKPFAHHVAAAEEPGKAGHEERLRRLAQDHPQAHSERRKQGLERAMARELPNKVAVTRVTRSPLGRLDEPMEPVGPA